LLKDREKKEGAVTFGVEHMGMAGKDESDSMFDGDHFLTHMNYSVWVGIFIKR